MSGYIINRKRFVPIPDGPLTPFKSQIRFLEWLLLYRGGKLSDEEARCVKFVLHKNRYSYTSTQEILQRLHRIFVDQYLKESKQR